MTRFGVTGDNKSASECSDEDKAATQMIVHRLDMDTSGLVVFGRNVAVTKELHHQFRERMVKKEYECLVQGHLPNFSNQHCGDDSSSDNDDDDDDSQTVFYIDLPLQRDHAHPPFMRISTPVSEREAAQVLKELHQRGWTKLRHRRPKPSQTKFRILERGERDGLPFSRLRLEPLTGRTHQLRVHTAALGHPIIGDPTYSLYGEAGPVGGIANISSYHCSQGKGDDKTAVGRVPQCPMEIQQAWTKTHKPNEQPMCLHAAMLEFKHPVTGETMRWDAPPDF